MEAVVFYLPDEVWVEDINQPQCGTDELLVKVEACAICGSDMKTIVSGNPRMIPPRVMGHEFVGTIVETGQSTSGFQIGERIVMATSISCGSCLYCRKGWPNLCRELAPMGFAYDGGMAEYVLIPSLAIKNGHVVKVTGKLPAKIATLAEPVSCAVNAVENCRISEGDIVVIVGAGPMGIINGCVAKAYGASRVIIAEINPDRLKQCEAFGFDRLVNPTEENLLHIVKKETDGYGADVAIIAAPAVSPQQDALNLVRKRGTVMLFASLPAGKSNINIDSRLVHYREINVTGCSDSTSAHVIKALELLSSNIFPAEKLVTHSLPLSEFDKGLELMKKGESLRVVLIPG